MFIIVNLVIMFYKVVRHKHKRVGYIPVQSTAVSRRLYKMRGSRLAVQGRSRLGTRLATQLTVTDQEDDGGVVRHKLPTKQKRKSRCHSLNDAVQTNKRSVRKH